MSSAEQAGKAEYLEVCFSFCQFPTFRSTDKTPNQWLRTTGDPFTEVEEFDFDIGGLYYGREWRTADLIDDKRKRKGKVADSIGDSEGCDVGSS